MPISTHLLMRRQARSRLIETGGQTSLMRAEVRAIMAAENVEVADRGFFYSLTLLGRRATSTISRDQAITNWATAVIDRDA